VIKDCFPLFVEAAGPLTDLAAAAIVITGAANRGEVGWPPLAS
jgi:hypothetical protein